VLKKKEQITMLSVLFVVALSIGVAMLDQMETRAQHERLRSTAHHKLQGNSPRSNAQW
jgi:hypothetical protein